MRVWELVSRLAWLLPTDSLVAVTVTRNNFRYAKQLSIPDTLK